MAFGKAVFAETFYLIEAPFRESWIVATLRHAVDHLSLEGADGADLLERRHRAAQAIRLRWREARCHDGDAHRLLLEQRHAERL